MTPEEKEITNFHVRFDQTAARWLRREARRLKFKNVPQLLKELVRQQMTAKKIARADASEHASA